MRTTSVARRYARALVDVGREDGSYQKYGSELRSVLGVFKGSPELYKVLLNPMYKLEERKALIGKVSEGMGLSAPVARFLDILVESRNIRSLEAVAAAYSDYEDELSGRLRATVEAPFELDPASLESVKAKVKSATGKEVILSFRKNPGLIGGMVVRMENTILDGSLRTQLELMKEKILEGVV